MLSTQKQPCRLRQAASARDAGPGVGGSPGPSVFLHTPPTKWDPTSNAMTRKSDRTPRWHLAGVHTPSVVAQHLPFSSCPPSLPPSLCKGSVEGKAKRQRLSQQEDAPTLAWGRHQMRKGKLCLDAASPEGLEGWKRLGRGS